MLSLKKEKIHSIKKYLFWGLSTSLGILVFYLYLNFHLPKGIWIGIAPKFLPEIQICLKKNERRRLLENTEIWIERLKKKIPVKIQMYNETIENLRRITLLSPKDKINMNLAIKQKEALKDLEIDFLIKAIKFNRKKINETQKLDEIDFCFKKYNVQWKMDFYRNNLTYKFRKIFFNEDKNFWNNEFKKKFSRTIF